MRLSNEISTEIEALAPESYDLLLTLAQIPAPSHHEEKRAEFCLNWLKGKGAEGAYTLFICATITKRF